MNRFWHTGPAMVWAVLDKAPVYLVQNALNPAAWLNTAVLLGTCERYPQVAIQYVREEVRNDLAGDSVIARPLMGQKVQVKCELNRWSQIVSERIQTEFTGARTGLAGVIDVMQAATMTDLLGNSCGLIVYYTDIVNRPDAALFVPMATVGSFMPVKIGNRTAAIDMEFESNTGFTLLSGRQVMFDYVKYANDSTQSAAVDAALAQNIGVGT